MIKHLYLIHRWDTNRYYHLVVLRVMVKKMYSTFLNAPELEPHHQMQFSVISRTLGWGEVLLICRNGLSPKLGVRVIHQCMLYTMTVRRCQSESSSTGCRNKSVSLSVHASMERILKEINVICNLSYFLLCFVCLLDFYTGLSVNKPTLYIYIYIKYRKTFRH